MVFSHENSESWEKNYTLTRFERGSTEISSEIQSEHPNSGVGNFFQHQAGSARE